MEEIRMTGNHASSKKQTIINYLLTKIANGELKVGDQIPPESELVKQFHFGRQTIHNALSDLALQGSSNALRAKAPLWLPNPSTATSRRR